LHKNISSIQLRTLGGQDIEVVVVPRYFWVLYVCRIMIRSNRNMKHPLVPMNIVIPSLCHTLNIVWWNAVPKKTVEILSTFSVPMNSSWFFKSFNDVLTGVPERGGSDHLSTNYRARKNESFSGCIPNTNHQLVVSDQIHDSRRFLSVSLAKRM